LLQGLTEDDMPQPLVLVTAGRWEKEAQRLGSSPKSVINIQGFSIEGFEAAARGCREASTVFALGDGPAMEAGRYAAAVAGARLIFAPAVITGEPLVRPAPEYAAALAGVPALEKAPDLLVIEPGLVWSGDEEATRSAAGDALSMAVAVEDWKRTGEGYDGDAAERSLDVLSDLMDRADDVYELTEGGIEALVAALEKRERLAGEMGHRRAVEGSAQAFMKCLYSLLGRPLPRGRLMCLAAVLMTELQGKTSRPVKQFLHWINVNWKPESMGIDEELLKKALEAAPEFARQNGWEATVLGSAKVDGSRAEKLVSAMRESFIRSSLMDRED